MVRRHINRLAVALAASVLLPAAISAAPAYALIGGGYTNDPGYVVALTYRAANWSGNAADREFCTGTLISSQWVLTAAHCLTGTRLRTYEMVIGRTTLSGSGGEIIPPERQFINPGYLRSGSAGHDVALVRLAWPAGEAPAPIADGSLAAQWAPGQSLLVQGWGYTCRQEVSSCQGDTLKSAWSVIKADSACARAVGGINKRTEICTKTYGISLGGGDSGGPAVISTGAGDRLVAVNSWGEIDGRERAVIGGWMGYAEVAGTELAAWVNNVMAAN
jgi:secreted trypsin-like serine protease